MRSTTRETWGGRNAPNDERCPGVAAAPHSASLRACVSGLFAAAFVLGGCTAIPQGRSAIDDVDIQGAHAIDPGEVADKLATGSTEKFFGLFRGVVYDYEVYDPSVLQRDMARVERYYRGKGFLEAHARVGRVVQVSPAHVRIQILVEEGPPTLNRRIQVNGLAGLPADVVVAAHRAADADLPVDGRFDEESYASAKDDLKKALTDHGYAYAKVEADASIDLAARRADYVLKVVPGPACILGKITIVGLDPDKEGPQPQEIDEAPLRRAMSLTAGARFSTADLDTATQALLELEVFSAVRIDPDLPEPAPEHPVVDLKVSVEPTRLRQVRAGGGVELDEIKTDLHLIAGWEDHNFLGGLRDLSITAQPGLVLYPFRLGHFSGVTDLLPEVRFKVQFRQPGFFEARTSAFVKPELNVYPFLVDANPPPGSPVIGYVEAKGAIGIDRPFFEKLTVSLAYNVQVEYPRVMVGILDKPVPTIVLEYPQLVTKLDLRDDPVHPHEGLYLANDLQIAGAVFGEARDVRIQPEVRGYIPLGKRVTLALRASVGLLFPSNYGVAGYLPDLNDTDPNRTKFIEETYFRGFTSGGPSTNRGYPIRGVAPYGFVPFLLPATFRSGVNSGCTVAQLQSGACSVPIAGLTLWEVSAEARIKVAGAFSTAIFCDSSDVTDTQATFRLDHPHVSCGLGARYDTPVGPIRLDVGYRINGMQVIGYTDELKAGREHPENGQPPQLFPNVPVAIAFGIGEAY